MTRIFPLFIAAAIGLGAAISAGGLALAQYPPPGGSVLCQGTVTVPQTGSSFQVIAQVTNTSGQPIANQLVQFQIIAQPGSSAFLSSNSGVTNSGGFAQVTLFTGTTPGQIVVKCSAPPPPPLIVQVLPPIQVVQVVPSGQVVAQVQSAVSVLQPPKTGDGGLLVAHRNALDLTPLFITTALIGLTVIAAGIRSLRLRSEAVKAG